MRCSFACLCTVAVGANKLERLVGVHIADHATYEKICESLEEAGLAAGSTSSDGDGESEGGPISREATTTAANSTGSTLGLWEDMEVR